MAHVDDLIAEITDSRLQLQLKAAVARIMEGRSFGLVFEDHIPETTLLNNAPFAAGHLVQLRTDSKNRQYRVLSVGSDLARIAPVDGGIESTAPVKDLLLVKRYGDPIYPVLTHLGGERRGGDHPSHAVIDGENFHALQLLVYLYEGEVDCVYLDPPYNTGAKDWKYNNQFVDTKDRWRHSKWLSMMENRLLLAKRLLRPADGVLVVTIDEHEVHHLGMLLERLFPEYLRHMVTIQINPKGTGKYNFARVDEYAFFCVPNTGSSVIVGTPKNTSLANGVQIPNTAPIAMELDSRVEQEDDIEEEDDAEEVDEVVNDEEETSSVRPFPAEELHLWELRHARRRGAESSYRHQRKNQFYPIYVDDKEKRVVDVGDAVPFDVLPDGAVPPTNRVNGLLTIWPVDDEGNHRCWRFTPTTMRNLVAANRVVLGSFNRKRSTYTLNIWERATAYKKLKTLWQDPKHDAGTHGTTLLHKMLGKRGVFPFPKSIYAVRDTLAAVVRNRPNALIVDVFAGSGTTFHATALLNASDGGSRRSVLVTNNEVQPAAASKLNKAGFFRGDPQFEQHGIFEQVTRPRCTAAVTGRRPDGAPIPGEYDDRTSIADGLRENVEFFRLGYADPDEVELGEQYNAIQPLLWLSAGAHGTVPPPLSSEVKWLIRPENRFAVLFRDSQFRGFQRELAKVSGVARVLLVTDAEEAFAEMQERLSLWTRGSMLYRDYLKTFSLNTERRP